MLTSGVVSVIPHPSWPSHGKPITAYDRTSRGAEAYTAFAAEFLKKQSA